MSKKFFVSFLFALVFISAVLVFPRFACATERYMVCTGTNVRVRATPSTKAKILYTIDKGRYVCVIEQKNTGEKFQWYNIEDDDGDGWIYGQFLRELEIKQNIDFKPSSIDGIPFGTHHSEINGLSKLTGNSRDIRWYAGNNMQSDGDWEYSAVNNKASTKNFKVTYLFDAGQKLIGMYIRAPWSNNSKAEKMYDQLEAQFGETQNMGVSHNGVMRGYNINGFKVFFGIIFSTGDGSGYYFTHYFVNKNI